MRTKLLIIGIASSFIACMGGCKSSCPPYDHIELTSLYINESGMPIQIKSFNTNFSDSTYSVQSIKEYRLTAADTLTLYNDPLYDKDSVFILFDNQKIIKNYPSEKNLKLNVYNADEYQCLYPNPDVGNQITEVYRFTTEHVEAATDLKE